jgi:hypothetical protein
VPLFYAGTPKKNPGRAWFNAGIGMIQGLAWFNAWL